MRTVYRHLPSGDLYVDKSGGFRSSVGLDGQHRVTLAPVFRLVAADTRAPLAREVAGNYDLLNKHHAHELVVTASEFRELFQAVGAYENVANSPIAEVLAHYEAECCDHSDLAWLVLVAKHYVESMADSQVRCLLHALANRPELAQALEPQGNLTAPRVRDAI